MMKYFIGGIGAGCVLIGIAGFAGALGWDVKSLAPNMLIPRVGLIGAVPVIGGVPAAKYCIKGKIYEKVTNMYVSVDSDRTCITIDAN
jgi:hypothetical protein